MNLQESIRRILREDKDHTNLLKGIIDSSDIFDYKHFCGLDIITPEERSDQYNFLNKNKIPYLIKVYFVGGPNSEVWPRTQAIRNKELDLMEELHEYIKSFVPFNIEMMGSHVNSCEGYDKLMKRKYSTDDLQESIKRILREEDYSPAGKEITPNKIVVHKSNPMFRNKIMENGLKVRAGECYKIYVGYGVKCKPAIFATNSTNKRAWFDSSYDDDIWEINTEMIPDVKWYKDRHFESRSKHIVTFQDIPKEAITLKYEGTGSGDVKKWDKDSPNLFESIKRILREEITEDKNLYGEKLKPCSTKPMTGFYRDGYCRTGDDDTGSHTVCAKVTEEFLEFTNSMGNNLDMLEPGDKWCLCAMRWKEAKDNGIYVKVDKSATNIKTLDII